MEGPIRSIHKKILRQPNFPGTRAPRSPRCQGNWLGSGRTESGLSKGGNRRWGIWECGTGRVGGRMEDRRGGRRVRQKENTVVHWGCASIRVQLQGGGGGLGGEDKKEGIIRFRSYVIRKIRNFSLESALRGMDHVNMDLGRFQETNLTDGVYMWGLSGYCVISTDTLVWHRGGMLVLYQDFTHFMIESHHQQDPNVVSFQLELGGKQ